MVRITNGAEIFEVTQGAYDNNFKKLGYTIMNDSKAKKTEVVNAEPEDTRSKEEKFIDEMKETPISKWSKADIKKFAELNGIDFSGTKNADEAREVISEFLK